MNGPGEPTMKTKMIMKIWLFMLGMLLLGISPAYGQVITPSMDPTQAILMPSAAGWREKEAVGIGYQEGSGTRDYKDEQIYQFDSSGMDGNLSLKVGNVFVEMYASQKKTDVKREAYSEGEINLQTDDGRLNIALAGNDFVTIGLGVRSVETKDEISANNNDETTKSMRTIGSISVKTLDMIFLGLGFERVKEESSYAVDLTWNNLIGGVGLQLGQPGGTRFRAEYSLANSDSEENGLEGDMTATSHPATSITRMSAELMFSGLLFSLMAEEAIEEVDIIENNEPVDEIKTVSNQGGVLWIPENGLSIGFYFLTNTVESSYDDSKGSFKVKLAYIF